MDFIHLSVARRAAVLEEYEKALVMLREKENANARIRMAADKANADAKVAAAKAEAAGNEANTAKQKE